MTDNPIDKRNIRIFISSTFNDMQSERNHLVDNVFPLLRQEAEKRGVTLTEVDLRWGITAKDSESGKVVELCMDEIVNSHPFFIGLLGDRYGWTPSKEELIKMDAIPERYDFIAQDLENGMSITEIEIQFGVLRVKDEVNASFYIKKSGIDKPDPRQERLKKAVRAQTEHAVYDYDSVEQLGEQVTMEFRHLLDRLFPEDKVPTVEEQRRIEQDTYILQKTQIYIPNSDDLDEIDQFIKDDDEQLMVVTGESGIGKSAMLAYWISQAEQKGLRIIPFFQSAVQTESPLTTILTYLISEITRYYELNEEIIEGSDESQLVEVFEKVLKDIENKEELVIVLDGINQTIDGVSHAKQLKWLPTLPANVKVIFSTLEEDDTIEHIRKRRAKEIKLYPMLADQKRELIIAYFDKFRKKLDDKYVDMLLENKHVTDNTLMLTLMLDDLRRFGLYDNMEKYIRDMVSSSTIDEFLDSLIERKEQRYDDKRCPGIVRDYLSAISLSEDGLAEQDIIGISAQPGLLWSYFYCGNRQLFVNAGGRIRFSHQQVRRAVETRYLKDAEYVEGIRNRILSYFYNHTDCKYGFFDEAAYQLSQLKRYDMLYKHLLEEDYLDHIFETSRQQTLMKYWGLLYAVDRKRYDITKYINNFTKFMGSDVNDVIGDEEIRRLKWEIESYNFASLVNLIAKYLEDFDAAYQMTLFMRIMDNKGETGNVSRSTRVANLLAICCMKKKRYSEALRLLKSDINPEREDLASSDSIFNIAEVYTYMAESLGNKSFYEKAVAIYEEILKARLNRYGEQSKHLAVVYANLAGIYHQLGKEKIGNEYRQRAISLYSESQGGNSLDMGIEMGNLAGESYEQGNYEESLEYAHKACQIYQEMGEGQGRHLLDSYMMIFKAAVAQGLYEEAESAVDEYVRLWPITYPIGPGEHEFPYNMLSYMYFQCESYQKAYDLCQKYIEVLCSEDEPDHDLLGTCYDALGKYCMNMDMQEECKANYHEAIEHRRRAGNMEGVASSLFYLGQALYGLGNIDESIQTLQASLEQLEEIGKGNEEEAAYCHYNIGVGLAQLNMIEAAAEHLRQALDIRLELFDEDDETTNMYRQSLAQLLNAQDDGQSNSGGGFVDDVVGDFEELADGNDELISLFKRGKSAFDVGNAEASIHCFEQAFRWCDEHNVNQDDIIRAPIYRLLAYSKERTHKDEYEKSVADDYQRSIQICISNKNYRLGRFCSKDWAEYNWNREQFDQAVLSYMYELGFLILSEEKDLKWQIMCLMNLCNAMSKGNYFDEELYLAASFYAYSRVLASGNQALKKHVENIIDYGLGRKAERDSHFHPEDYQPQMHQDLCVIADYFSRFGMSNAAEKLLRSFAEAVADQLDERTVTFYFTLYRKLIEIYIRNGFNEYAIQIIEEVANRICDIDGAELYNDELIYLLAITYHKSMRFQQMIELLSNCELNDSLKLMMADCYYSLQEYEKALDMLKEISESFEFDGSACLVFARIILGLGDAENADYYLDFDNSKMTKAEQLQIMCSKAVLETLRGNNREAILYVHQVKKELQDYPISASVEQAAPFWALIDALRLMNMNDEAMTVLREFQQFLHVYQAHYVQGMLEECNRLEGII